MDELEQKEIAAQIAKKLTKLICQKTDPDENLVTASIGISIFPHDGLDLDSLLRAADLSMFEVKKTKADCRSNSTNSN